MKNFLKTVLGLVIIVLVGWWVYYVFFQKGPSDAQVLSRLNSIILLNESTAPSMAIVTDADAVRKLSPTFFANAKVGDRVIIYPDVTIVYDYIANKIININYIPVANPVTLGSSTTSASSATSSK